LYFKILHRFVEPSHITLSRIALSDPKQCSICNVNWKVLEIGVAKKGHEIVDFTAKTRVARIAVGAMISLLRGA